MTPTPDKPAGEALKVLKAPGRYLIQPPETPMSNKQRAWEMWAVHLTDLDEMVLTREQFYLAHLTYARTPPPSALDDEVVERASRDRKIFANACAKADAFAESLTRTDPPVAMDGPVFELAKAAGRLVAATDSQEELRAERQAVLDALTRLKDSSDLTEGKN